MMTKLAFSTLGCPEWPVDRIIAEALKNDIPAIELRGRVGEHIGPETPDTERDAIRRQLRDAGVELLGITAYSRFGSLDAAFRADQEADLLRCVALANEMGATYVRTFLYEPGDPEVQGDALTELRGLMAESINRVAQQLPEGGPQVLIETHGRISQAAALKPVLDQIPSKRVGVLWDFAHGFRQGESLDEAWDLIGDRIGYIHVKDEQQGPDGTITHCHIGDGDMPLEALIALLDAREFAGTLCLEWERKWHPEMPPLDEALPRFTRFFRKG